MASAIPPALVGVGCGVAVAGGAAEEQAAANRLKATTPTTKPILRFICIPCLFDLTSGVPRSIFSTKVANLLTMMMGPEVLLLPSLTQIPDSVLANVYVFTNGVKGGGPFGFQPDVFDSVPGDSGYSPLRSINLVAWEEGATTRELGSVEDWGVGEPRVPSS